MFDNSAYMSNISLERTCDILKFTRSSIIVIMDNFGNILSDNDTIISNHRQPNKSKSPTVPSQFKAKLWICEFGIMDVLTYGFINLWHCGFP